MMPIISIGLPVYNAEAYLVAALDCHLAQSFEDFELVVCDNASTDRTAEICRAYAARDRRIRYFRNESNIGGPANHNRVLDLSRGPYFRWAGHDDLIAPTFLASCLALLEADPNAVLCHARTRLIDINGLPCRPDSVRGGYIDASGQHLRPTDRTNAASAARPAERFRDILLNTHYCFEMYGLVRTEALRQAGPMGVYYGSDKVLLAALSLYGRFREVPEPLFLRRCHPRQSSSVPSWEKACFIDPRHVHRLAVPQIAPIAGYLQAIRKAPLRLREKAGCLAAVAWLALKAEKWRKLLTPSATHMFGIEIRRGRPKAG